MHQAISYLLKGDYKGAGFRSKEGRSGKEKEDYRRFWGSMSGLLWGLSPPVYANNK